MWGKYGSPGFYYFNRHYRLILRILVSLLVVIVLYRKYARINAISVSPFENVFVKRIYMVDEFLNGFVNYTQSDTCELPQLSLTRHASVSTPIECRSEYEWSYLKDSKWYLTDTVKQLYGYIKCTYRSVTRIDDFKLNYSPEYSLEEGQHIPHEFLHILCHGSKNTNSSSSIKNEKIHAQIMPKLFRLQSYTPPDGSKCDRLNVLLLSYDSVSRVSWLLRLKKSYDYMMNTMGFDEFLGSNIIGDGTPACLTPVLTGKTEEELPSTLKTDKKGMYVDEAYPFIWKELNERGYATLWNQDWPQVGIWTYRLRGMKNEITTHYLRPFQMMLWDSVLKSYSKDDLCIGTKKRHTYNLDLLTQFQETYKNLSKNTFVFQHYVENSHDSNSRLNLIDDGLHDFLKSNYENGNFENTAIFLYGDHGDRFNEDRQTTQGYLEERLPFLSLFLPKWYREKYPEKYENVKKNRDTLVVPFDIHETLRELTCLDSRAAVRACSLLSEIPKTRKCHEAGVLDHYCTCLEWHVIDETDTCKSSGQFVVDYINKKLLQYRLHCEVLKLDTTVSCKFAIGAKNKLIRVQLTTLPNNGQYEATIVLEPKQTSNIMDSFTIRSLDFISRLNKYGDDAKCVQRLRSPIDLRKFCYCKRR